MAMAGLSQQPVTTTNADSIKGKVINSVPSDDQFIMKYFTTGDSIGWTADGGGAGGGLDSAEVMIIVDDSSKNVLGIELADTSFYVFNSDGDSLGQIWLKSSTNQTIFEFESGGGFAFADSSGFFAIEYDEGGALFFMDSLDAVRIGLADFLLLSDGVPVRFGDGIDWQMFYDESVDDQLLLSTTKTATQAVTDPMFEILVGTTPTADQQVFGIAKGTQSSNTPLFTVDEDGDVIVTGTTTLQGVTVNSNIDMTAGTLTNVAEYTGVSGSDMFSTTQGAGDNYLQHSANNQAVLMGIEGGPWVKIIADSIFDVSNITINNGIIISADTIGDFAGDGLQVASNVLDVLAGVGIIIDNDSVAVDTAIFFDTAELFAYIESTSATILTAVFADSAETFTDGIVTYLKMQTDYRDSLGNLDQAETITANWDNTAVPWADDEVADNITASSYLPLTGGTMAGDINMDGNAIRGAHTLSTDTLIVDHDTSYADHIISYLIRLDVRNASGVTIAEGTPVYISGATGDMPNIDSARADTPAMMPAIGIVEHDIANGENGHVIVFGQYGPFNTLAWSVQDVLYVGATGGLTNTKPTGTNLIQRIATVTRDNVSQGDIQIVGAGRSNDIPNIADSNFWVGNGSGVPTAVDMTGDVTMSNAGVTSIGVDKIDSTNIVTSGISSTDLNLAMAPVWTGPHDFGGATSLEIPNGNNPTIDTTAKIAWDNNGDAFKVGITPLGDTTVNAFIGGIQVENGLVFRFAAGETSGELFALSPHVPIFDIETEWAPHGIEILSVKLTTVTPSDGAFIFELWDDIAGTTQDTIEVIQFAGAGSPPDDTERKDITISGTSTIPAGNIIMIEIPESASPGLTDLKYQITYYLISGN